MVNLIHRNNKCTESISINKLDYFGRLIVSHHEFNGPIGQNLKQLIMIDFMMPV